MRIFTFLFIALMIGSVSVQAQSQKLKRVLKSNVHRESVVLKKMTEPNALPGQADHIEISAAKSISKVARTTANASMVLVDSSRNGYGWLNSSIKAIDYFNGPDASGAPADFVLLGYRQYIVSNIESGIIGATTIDVSSGLENGASYRHVELNQDLYSGTIGGRYPGVVALDRPFVAFNQYKSGNANTTPAISSPYLITDYGTYGPVGGAWTSSSQMDVGYTHHDSPGGNRLWNGPVVIVKDAGGIYHYCAVYANWFLDSEALDNDHAIMVASTNDPTSTWTIDTDPVLIDPDVFTLVSPCIAMNSSGFGVIASAGHAGYHEGTSYLYSELRVTLQTTSDFGQTWSAAREVDWPELGIPTEVTLADSLEYYIDDSTTAFYDSTAFVGTNFDMDVVVGEDNDVYIGFNLLWGRPSEDGWYPHYFHSGPHVAVSYDGGSSFTASRITANNGFFEGDSIIPGMSAVFFDSEIDLALDEQGNVYAAWLDRPNSPVELAEKPRYSATADLDYKTDVFTARSLDGGTTWSDWINVTNSVSLDEYQLKMAKSANSREDGTVFVGYHLVDPATDPFTGGDDIYTDRVNRIWVAEASGFPGTVGLEDAGMAGPRSFSLKQNYPNPFNPRTRIEFTAAATGLARLDVFDVTGQKVAAIFNGQVQRGLNYQFDFDGRTLAAGIYFYRLSNGATIQAKKMILVK